MYFVLIECFGSRKLHYNQTLHVLTCHLCKAIVGFVQMFGPLVAGCAKREGHVRYLWSDSHGGETQGKSMESVFKPVFDGFPVTPWVLFEASWSKGCVVFHRQVDPDHTFDVFGVV